MPPIVMFYNLWYTKNTNFVLITVILFPNTFCRIFDSKIFLRHAITNIVTQLSSQILLITITSSAVSKVCLHNK